MPAIQTPFGQIPNDTSFIGAIAQERQPTSLKCHFDARTGGESRVIYQGQPDDIRAMAINAQEDGFAYVLTVGPVWELELVIPWDVITNGFLTEPEPFVTWEVDFIDVEQNIMESKDRPFISALSTTAKTSIELSLRQPHLTQPVVSGQDVRQLLNAMVVCNLKRTGVEGKRITTPVLKRSIICGNKYAVSWDKTTWGKLFTTEELIDAYGKGKNKQTGYDPYAMPAAIKGRLPLSYPIYYTAPNGNQVKFPQTGYLPSGIPIPNKIVTFCGWLESPMELTTISPTKIQATQTWTFNLWSAGKYGLYDPALPDKHPEPTIS